MFLALFCLHVVLFTGCVNKNLSKQSSGLIYKKSVLKVLRSVKIWCKQKLMFTKVNM
jgi:hypothetical protein